VNGSCHRIVDVPPGAAVGTKLLVTLAPPSSAMKVPGWKKDENTTVNPVTGAVGLTLGSGWVIRTAWVQPASDSATRRNNVRDRFIVSDSFRARAWVG
jgi:hypothetical protein